MTLLLNSII